MPAWPRWRSRRRRSGLAAKSKAGTVSICGYGSGLNSGEVIAGEIGSGPVGYTAIGEQVGMAQRMESAAPPGGVMLSASTARLVDGAGFSMIRSWSKLRGPISRCRPSAVGHGRTAIRPSGVPKRHLVGRRWEMAAVEGLLERARGPRSGRQASGSARDRQEPAGARGRRDARTAV